MTDTPQRLKAFTSNSGKDYGLFFNEKANHDTKIFFKGLILPFSSTTYLPKPSAKSDILHPVIEEGLIKQCLKPLY